MSNKKSNIINFKAKSVLTEMQLDINKEDNELSELEKLMKKCKEYKESNTLPLRREILLIAITQLQELTNGIIAWKQLMEKHNIDFSEYNATLEAIKTIMQSYLGFKLKNIKNAKMSPIVGINYMLSEMYKVAKVDDTFMNMEYQPLIFLRQISSNFNDLAISISTRLKQNDTTTQELLQSASKYFPRGTRKASRDVQGDQLRKMNYIDKVVQEAKGKQFKDGKPEEEIDTTAESKLKMV